MQMEYSDDRVIKNNIDNQISFGIEQNSSAFSILADRLYTRKEQSVIRELSTNAYDEHIVAGKSDVPFDVHLPTVLENWFSIRDYGNGLSHDDAVNLYTRFFKSTKRDNNMQTGCLGLGSKSPFAVTNSFTVESWNNGIKSTYTCYKDDNDAPKMSLLESKPSDEPSGLKVQFVVDGGHYDWKHEAVRVYKFFKLKPKCNIQLNFDLGTPVLNESNWGIYNNDDNYSIRDYSFATMGNVAYPIVFDAIKTQTSEEQKLIKLFRYVKGLVINFDLGELGFTTNREALEYNKKTNDALLKSIDKILNDLKIQIKTEINDSESLFSARQKLGSYHMIINSSLGNEFTNLIFNNTLTWNGQNFEEYFFKTWTVKVDASCSTIANFDKKKAKDDARHFQIRQNDSVSYCFNHREFWFINDRSKNLEKRIKLFLHRKEKSDVIGYLIEESEKEKVLSQLGVEKENIFVSNSDLPEIVKKQRNYLSGSVSVRKAIVPAKEWKIYKNGTIEKYDSTISVKQDYLQYYLVSNRDSVSLSDNTEITCSNFKNLIIFANNFGFKIRDGVEVKVVNLSRAKSLKLQGRLNFRNFAEELHGFVKSVFENNKDKFVQLLDKSLLSTNAILFLSCCDIDGLSKLKIFENNSIGKTIELLQNPISKLMDIGFVTVNEKKNLYDICSYDDFGSSKAAENLIKKFTMFKRENFDLILKFLLEKNLINDSFSDNVLNNIGEVNVSLNFNK